MATSNNCLGLTQLMSLGGVVLSQKVTYFERNKYTVLAPDGSVIMYAKEDSGSFFFGGSGRRFDMDILDTQKRLVISLRRPLTFGPDKMEVSVCGQVVSIIRQKMTFMQPVISVNDARDEPVLKVKGPKISMTIERDFEVFSGETRIGMISKVWSGMSRELFSHADDFTVQFPEDLDVRYKCALIGAAVLIDFLYYEK